MEVIQCLFCGHEKLVRRYSGIYDRLHMSQARYEIWQCCLCRSFRVHPLPSPEEIPSLYPEAYAFKKQIGHKFRQLWNNLEWQIFYSPVLGSCVKLISQETGLKKGKILDVGCGSGLRLLKFRQAGFEPEGIDFSEEDVKYVKERLGLKVRAADVEKEDLPPAEYDLIIAYWLLEHVREPEVLVRKTYAALKPGGWVALGIPLADSLVASLFSGRWSQVKEAPRHLGIPSRKGMKILLAKVGFSSISYQPVSSLELAVDIALSLWPAGNFVLTQKKWGVLHRLFTGWLTLLSLPPIALIKTLSFPQSLTVFFGQKPHT
ncbi:MAG: class I SAM-dependent methyltransferase [Candidatus Omnitrophica bacterium]|nr:class I SAM-dependent methyltransferase [Candidatus Omnitrophota bacterium]